MTGTERQQAVAKGARANKETAQDAADSVGSEATDEQRNQPP
jgi:hypothetical protein